jgi:hypothetical protein
VLVAQRTLLLNRIDYMPEEYAGLHKYFGDVAAGDEEQIVLRAAAAAAAVMPAPKPGGQ